MRTSNLLPHLLTTTLLTSTASADFFVSNTSVCMGARPFFSQCTRGVKVLSNISNNTADPSPFSCSHLIHAEDNNYIHNGTMAPVRGDPYPSSVGGVCGSGQLNFVRDWESGEYVVNDVQGNVVGNCVAEKNVTDPEMHVRCSQWVGMLYFATAFKCKSWICG